MTAPLLVAHVDLAAPAAGIAALTGADARYRAARVLVTHGSQPVRTVDVTLPFDPWSPRSPLLHSTSASPVAEPELELPSATVVVPSVFARSAQLRAGVAALAALDHPDFEIVVVDNRAAPVRAEWAPLEALPRVRVISEPRPGISAARNAGIRAARGEIVAFTDDDVRVDPRWLRALTGRFVTEPALSAVLGIVLAGELESPAQLAFEDYDAAVGRFGAETSALVEPTAPWWSARRYTVAVDGPAGRTESWLYQLGGVMGANMAFRRSALLAVGDFDPALGTGTRARGGEDLDVVTRLLFAGRRIGYEPSALVWHSHRRTDAELRHQMDGYGVGFTAMLTAAILRDPRHLVGLVHTALAVRRAPSGGPDRLDPALRALEKRGQRRGPAAYLTARLTTWRGVR